MSQILRRLSETDVQEEQPSVQLKSTPEHIFYLSESTSRNNSHGNRTLFLRFGILVLALTLIAVSAFAFRKHEHAVPLRDFSKLLQDQVVSLNREAIESFYAGNLEKASGLLKHAEVLDPKNLTSQINRGIILRHLNQTSEAVSEFTHVLALSAENPSALNGLGRIHLDAGELNDAEKLLKRAAAGSPAPAETFLNLGELAELQGDWLLASGYYNQYLQNPAADSALKIMVSRRNQNIVAIAKAKE